MTRVPIKGSSNILSAGYENGVFEIEFQGGKVYEIKEGITPKMYRDFCESDSKGSWYHANVRAPGIAAQRKEEEKQGENQ